MRLTTPYIRPSSGSATQHLRPVLTDWLTRAVHVPVRGARRCTPGVVGHVVLWAAAFARSVAAVCAARTAAPSGQAIWNALYAALPQRRRTLERRLRAALHAPLTARNRRRAVPVAIDYHRIAYYGVANRDTTRAKSTAGTHTFHTDATACRVGTPDRYTIGLTAVSEHEPFTDVLARLLDRIAAAGVTPRVLLLDKAFFAIAVMRLLQSRGVPFVIPAVVRGRKPRPGVKAVGLRAVRQRPAGRYAYTHEDRGQSVRVCVVVAHKSYHTRAGGRRTRKWLYATWRVRGGPVAVRDLYRTRFGVESSYRQLKQVRPRTSTTNGVVRLLWVAVGLIVRNAWVQFRADHAPRYTLALVCMVLMTEEPTTSTGPPDDPQPSPANNSAIKPPT